jgi:hypothetical protein
MESSVAAGGMDKMRLSHASLSCFQARAVCELQRLVCRLGRIVAPAIRYWEAAKSSR